jgi:hypothetical protein
MTAVQCAWVGLCLPLLLAACAGSGEGLDESGRPGEPGNGDGVLMPDLQSIQDEVFTPICTQCHIGAGAPAGLRLDAASSYGSLVGVPSSEVPSLLRVKPGDPGSSYLVQKLEGRAAVGDRMPLGQPALPAATIAVIRQWISDGAPDVTAAGDARLAVKAVSASTQVISIALTRGVDASLVNATNVVLERSAATTEESEVVRTRARTSDYNDALILVVPERPLEPGDYRLVLRGTGPAALADWNAEMLDGDGDGSPGGDWRGTLTFGGAP